MSFTPDARFNIRNKENLQPWKRRDPRNRASEAAKNNCRGWPVFSQSARPSNQPLRHLKPDRRNLVPAMGALASTAKPFQHLTDYIFIPLNVPAPLRPLLSFFLFVFFGGGKLNKLMLIMAGFVLFFFDSLSG